MIAEEQYRKAYLTFLSAKGFMSTADIIRQVSKKDGLKLFTYYAYPLTVNSAFACELFIKALLTLEGKTYNNIHKLKELFNELSDETKDEINNKYSMSNCKETVESLLNTYNTAFIDWRYPFDESLLIKSQALNEENLELGWKA